MITDSTIFSTLTLLALALTILSFHLRAAGQGILLSISAFIVWFSLFLWLFISTSAPIGLGEQWKDVLVWAFVVLAFIPLVLQFDFSAKLEERDQRLAKKRLLNSRSRALSRSRNR